MTLDEVRAKKKRLLARQAKIDREFAAVTREHQSICDHGLLWEQAAGEGISCRKCGLRDYSND